MSGLRKHASFLANIDIYVIEDIVSDVVRCKFPVKQSVVAIDNMLYNPRSRSYHTTLLNVEVRHKLLTLRV